jgi:3-(3-hydroxy-phenyl)propionate hydroxylase
MNAPSDLLRPDPWDVAIIGYGPAGVTLANLLAQRGLDVLVLERDAEPYRLPRAISFDAECMRVFQTVGVARELEPHVHPGPGMRFLNAAGQLLIEWRRPDGSGPQGWHSSYRFFQPGLEATLRDRLTRYDRVDVRLRHEVFAIEPDPDGVRLRLEDLNRGRLLQARARWVVGCDGARSTVRRFMGTELDDLQSHERWLVVDVMLTRERPDLGDFSIQYCEPERPCTYVRGPGMRRRWELMVMPGEDPAELTRPEVLWRLLSRWVTPEDGVLERPASYTFHSVVARGWRHGRLLIAGDAAHQTPPFLGQGMCAGIRDAANLAWKLDEVIRRRAPASLLDTYESERLPHVREFIETAVRLGRVIQATDPQAVRERDADLAAHPMRFTVPQPRLGPGAHDNDGPAGLIGEQPTMGDGTLLDDRVGYHWALLAHPALAAQAQALAGDRAVVIEAEAGPSADWLERLGVRAVLLRPDRHVAGVAEEPGGLAGLAARYLAATQAAHVNLGPRPEHRRLTNPRRPD